LIFIAIFDDYPEVTARTYPDQMTTVSGQFDVVREIATAIK